VFDKADVKRWRRVIHKELRRMRLPSDDPTYPAAMVLAAIYCFGTDVSVLAEVTGVNEQRVRQTLKALRKRGIVVGQRLRTAMTDEKTGGFAWILDAMVASGDLYRPPDPKRSAAMKGRKRGPNKQPRRPRTKIMPGAIFTPKVVKSNPLYGLAEWEK
jgi:hypothetical protein